MKSRSKNRSRRLLLVLGTGTGAACSLEFLSLFAKAGFSVFSAIHESGRRWVAPEALRLVSSHSCLTTEEQPAWAHNAEGFDLAIGIGLPLSFLLDQASQASPIADCFFNRCSARVLLINHGVTLSEAQQELLHQQTLFFQTLPQEIGSIQETLRHLFSELLLVSRRKAAAAKFSVQIQRSVPDELASLAGRPPRWQESLAQVLRLAGFSLHPETGAQPPDVVIETYEGPFLKARATTVAPGKSGGSAITVTFDASADAPLSGKVLNLRFLHPQASQTVVAKHLEAGELVLVRQKSGDLLVHGLGAARLIPELVERPALKRLMDLLLDRLTISPPEPV